MTLKSFGSSLGLGLGMGRRGRWSWHHDALVLAVALALVWSHCAAQDSSTAEESSTGDESSTAEESSTGDESSSTAEDSTSSSSSSSSSTGIAARNRTNGTVPWQFVPNPRPATPRTYCPATNMEPMRVYDNITLCVVVGGKAKILYYINIDEFSVVQIIAPKNATALPDGTGLWDHPQLWFQAEYGNMSSPMKWRHPQVANTSSRYGWVVPYWTLIINLKNGVAESLEWDDGCYGCSDSGDACVEDTCAIDPVERGCTDPTSTADCNPKFFVSWFGTDRNGQYLTSSGSRSSRYRFGSISSAFNSAYQSASDIGDDLSKRNGFKFDPTCTSDPNQAVCNPDG